METIKEFQDKSNIEIIQKLLELNKGYITTKQITELGIHRTYLKIMLDRNLIEKVGPGIYMDINLVPDNYYIFSLITPNAVFSHQTALNFYHLSNENKSSKEKYDITVKKDYHNSRLEGDNVFRVSKDLFELGLTEVETSLGNIVKAYDVERCICDLIRSKKRMNLESTKYSFKEYLKRKDKDLIKLETYAKKLGVKKGLFEILTWMS